MRYYSFPINEHLRSNVLSVVKALAKDFNIHKPSKYSTDCEIEIEVTGDIKNLDAEFEISRTDGKNVSSHTITLELDSDVDGNEYALLTLICYSASQLNREDPIEPITSTCYANLITSEKEETEHIKAAINTNEKKDREKMQAYKEYESKRRFFSRREVPQNLIEFVEDTEDVSTETAIEKILNGEA
ncbi:hypothetical protein ACYSNR_00825 [Enterococcus sp. LJL128]